MHPDGVFDLSGVGTAEHKEFPLEFDHKTFVVVFVGQSRLQILPCFPVVKRTLETDFPVVHGVSCRGAVRKIKSPLEARHTGEGIVETVICHLRDFFDFTVHIWKNLII